MFAWFQLSYHACMKPTYAVMFGQGTQACMDSWLFLLSSVALMVYNHVCLHMEALA